MELSKIIGKNVKQLREEGGMSQVDVARELGLTQATVARYEKGINFPKEEHVLWYADRFNVSLDWIYGRTGQRKGRLLKKSMEKYMSDDVKKLIGNSLEPGQDVYEMIKQRVEEMATEMIKNKKK